MALFKPYKITSDKLADLPVREGQIIVTTDTHRLFVDVSATERMEVTSDAEVDLTDYVTTTMLTSALGEEASEREKQDNLLDDKIDTKLDTTQADDRYALKDNPKLTGNASITGENWLSAKITGAHSNGEIEDYYKYVIGFDALHRPYIGRKEGEDTVSMIYLDTDKIVFNKPLAFTGSSGLESGNAEAAAQTRQNIGAAAIEHIHDAATTDSAGFMSAEDKTTLDGLAAQDLFTKDEADELYAAIDHNHDDRYYTESEVDSKLSAKADAIHTHTIGQVDNLQETIDGLESDIAGKANATHTHDDRYFTETEITDKLAAKADTGHKHAASDVTSGTFSLDRIPTITDAKISGLSASKLTGTIPTANLPSYVDDVVEGETTADFPETGETGKIYVATSTNKTYRWSGSEYVEISASLALGTTSSTAFRGDYGNVAYTHATAKGSAFASGLYKITTNAQGHVTAATAVTKSDITALGIPGQDTNTTYSAATTSTAGLMSAADKTKLDGIASGANRYTLPAATTSALGGVRIGFPESGKNYPVELNDSNQMFVNVPWTDTNTTYTLSSFGITATAAELNKLDGVTATAAEINYLDGVTSSIQSQLNTKAGLVSDKTDLKAGDDLNDFDTIGTYRSASGTITAEIANIPNGTSGAGFLLWVVSMYGKESNFTGTVLQIFMGGASGNTPIWIRRGGAGAWSAWQEVYTSTNKPTAAEIGAATSSHTHSNATTSAAGFLPKLGGGTTNYLRADGTWAKPPDTNTTYTLSSFGITATAAELNKLDGLATTKTELGYLDGVTSNVQTQLNGKAASSHTHSYLPLSGGTLTGNVTARTITPSADSTYNIGSSTVRYANIYADTFTGALSGNATSATSAAYWTTARTLSFTGDVTGSVSVRGNANMSCALTIGSGKVGTAELATDAVTSAKIAANAVTASEIASGAVGLSELSSAVGTVAVQSATPTDSHVKLWIKV